MNRVIVRFLRHVPVVYVDYPGQASLVQIYGTFNRAMLRLIPSLRTYAEPLTNAMVELYLLSQVGQTGFIPNVDSCISGYDQQAAACYSIHL